MSRDQRPGRANLIDGAAQRTAATRATPPVVETPVIDLQGPALAKATASRRTLLLAIVFVVASAAGGIGVSVLQGLL